MFKQGLVSPPFRPNQLIEGVVGVIASGRYAEAGDHRGPGRLLGGINPHECEIQLNFDTAGKLDNYNYSSGC